MQNDLDTLCDDDDCIVIAVDVVTDLPEAHRGATRQDTAPHTTNKKEDGTSQLDTFWSTLETLEIFGVL